MPFVFARHKVRDYAAWKVHFDAFRETRRAAGERAYKLFHSENDPNDIHMMFKFDNFDSARAFLESPELAAAMEAAGVLEPPDIVFVEKYEGGET